MQWMVPRNRLTESQLYILDKCLKKELSRHWIQGFAGSGKTVLLVHSVIEALAINPDLSVCVVVYTHALKDLVTTGIPEHLSGIPVMTYHSFRNNPQHYDMIIVDEVQDLEEVILKLLVKHCDKLIIAGDVEQSIYHKRLSPEDIERIVSPSKHKCEELFRLTERIREIVCTILPNSKIYGAKISRMANVQVTLAKAESVDQEIDWCWQQSEKFASQGDPSAILFPNHKLIRTFIERVCDFNMLDKPRFERTEKGKVDYKIVNNDLKESGLSLQYLGNKYGSLAESDQRPLVYLMTYHSAKGLDYETVFLPHLNQGIVFWENDQELERRLFFVAMTRSRRNLFMSYYSNQPHSLVQSMPQNLLHKIECKVQKHIEDEEEIFF